MLGDTHGWGRQAATGANEQREQKDSTSSLKPTGRLARLQVNFARWVEGPYGLYQLHDKVVKVITVCLLPPTGLAFFCLAMMSSRLMSSCLSTSIVLNCVPLYQTVNVLLSRMCAWNKCRRARAMKLLGALPLELSLDDQKRLKLVPLMLLRSAHDELRARQTFHPRDCE